MSYVYPNPVIEQSRLPAFNSLSKTCRVYNAVGSLVNEVIYSSKQEILFNKTDYLKGIYFYRVVFSDNTAVSGKFMVE
jgi:hypothetical protein